MSEEEKCVWCKDRDKVREVYVLGRRYEVCGTCKEKDIKEVRRGKFDSKEF